MIAPIARRDARVGNPAMDDDIIAQRRDDPRIVPGMERFQRGHVEMIVVIVRQQYRIDRGQSIQFDTQGRHAPGTGEGHGACAIRPDRIGQDVEARRSGSVTWHGLP